MANSSVIKSYLQSPKGIIVLSNSLSSN